MGQLVLALFLGYDPGGRGDNGVAAAAIGPDGTFGELVISDVVEHAAAAIEWLDNYEAQRPASLRIDRYSRGAVMAVGIFDCTAIKSAAC